MPKGWEDSNQILLEASNAVEMQAYEFNSPKDPKEFIICTWT